jgi:DNA N-6-adenine-methyltransferase (Dam)
VAVRKGIGSHQCTTMKNDEWLTPPEIIKALGDFDLDPCSPVDRPWPTARKHFTVQDDGLSQEWRGRVWCNPPYGLQASQWLSRCADHGNAIALIFGRTETKMFFDYVWPVATGILFIQGRIHFHYVDGRRAKANSGAPSVLVSYGQQCSDILRGCSIPGHFVRLSATNAR